MTKQNPQFLTLAEVIEIHHNQIELYGGEDGIRDISLLSSALAQPEASFDDNYLHNDIYEMAAAYAYHICQNHPFIDGNKRVALVTALIFLEFNNIEIDDPNEILYKTIIDLASSKLSKKDLGIIFKSLAK